MTVSKTKLAAIATVTALMAIAPAYAGGSAYDSNADIKRSLSSYDDRANIEAQRNTARTTTSRIVADSRTGDGSSRTKGVEGVTDADPSLAHLSPSAGSNVPAGEQQREEADEHCRDAEPHDRRQGQR